MAGFEWEGLLWQWSREIIESDEFELEPEVVEAGWLGYAAASEEQIRQTEARLGVTLPPSYREFLKVSNGWRTTGTFIPKIWSTAEVNWYVARNAESINKHIEYQRSWPKAEFLKTFGEGKEHFYHEEPGEGAEATVNAELYLTALEISDREIYGTAIYLLNPQAINSQGEWEAWFDAHWLPGTCIYSSFWELMNSEHHSFLELVKGDS